MNRSGSPGPDPARVDVDEILARVDADTAPDQPNLLLIRINYRIRTNNAVGNMVYPFYIGER